MVRSIPCHSRGFTLIELLVVISIIGLLSSIMLVALKSARTKSQESVIIQDLVQFRDLYENTYSASSGYSALQPSKLPRGTCTYYSSPNGYLCTVNTTDDCSNVFGSSNPDINNNPTALSLCKQIVSMTGNLFLGLSTTNNQKYSLSAELPSQQKYLCYGSSKNNSITVSAPNDSSNISPGCPVNP